MNVADRLQPEPIRVAVLTDLPGAEGCLRQFLQGHARFTWVGSAAELARAEKLLGDKKPDVVLVDLDGGHDVATVSHVAAMDGSTRVLALATMEDEDLIKRSILAGACGVVFRSEAPGVLVTALECVTDGEIWVGRKTAGDIMLALARTANERSRDPEQMKIAQLTARERHVVEIVAVNTTARNKIIASQLHISVHTLRNHLSAIYGKLEVPSRSELVAYAYRHGLVPLRDPESR